jgi:TRAP-type C4-dicarboxylate transport system permease small subunit
VADEKQRGEREGDAEENLDESVDENAAAAAAALDAPGPAAVLGRIDAALGKAELMVVSISLVLLVAVAVYQFIAVNLLNQRADWTDELIRYSVFFTAMSAAALAAQQKKMMAIDVVPRLLSPRTRAYSRILIALFVAFACYLLFQGGMMNRDEMAKLTENYHIIDPTLGVLALPIGAALIGVHFLIHAVIEINYLAQGRTPPEPRPVVH